MSSPADLPPLRTARVVPECPHSSTSSLIAPPRSLRSRRSVKDVPEHCVKDVMELNTRAAVPTRTGEGAYASTCLGGLGFAATLSEALDQEIEHGDKEQVEDRAHDHATENGGAYGVASVLAGAARGDQGDNAEDEGEGGHEDGTEADAGRFDGGF